MDKLKDVVMKLFVKVSPEQETSIQGHIDNFISDFKPPDHPPYAAMIERSIEELNERRGSSEESISQYIRKQYTGLPLAHNSLLKHHLGELTNSGEILATDKHLYLLPGTNARVESCVTTEKDKPKRKKGTKTGCGRNGRIGKKDEEFDEHAEIYVKAKGKIDRCDREKDELIGAHNKFKVDCSVNKFREFIPVVDPTLEFCVTTEDDKKKRKRRKRKGSGRIGKKHEESDEHGKNIHGETKGETDRCNEKKDELVGKYNEMEVDHNVDKLEELTHVIETETQDSGM